MKQKRTYIVYNPEFKPFAEQRGRFNSDRFRSVEYPSKGLRFVGTAHELCRTNDDVPLRLVEHTGWYTDNDHYETVHGVVYQLPARNGHCRYVPGVNDPWNDAAVLDFHSITDSIRDAVSWSDDMAKAWAEDCREEDAKFRAEQRIGDITNEIADLREDRRSLIKAVREACMAITKFPPIIKALREDIQRKKRASARLYKEREKLRENYWEAVPNL